VIDFLAEGHLIELLQERFVEAFADSIGLGFAGLGPGMVNVLNSQVELVLVVLAGATVLSAAVGKNTQERNSMSLEKRQDAVVEHIGGDQGVLAVIKLGRGDLRVGIDEGLLVDSPHPFEGSNIERILGSQIAGMFGFDLAMGLFIVLGLLQRDDLALGEDQAVLGDLGFQGLQTQLEGLQVMTQPDAADAAGRDEEVLLCAFGKLEKNQNLSGGVDPLEGIAVGPRHPPFGV